MKKDKRDSERKQPKMRSIDDFNIEETIGYGSFSSVIKVVFKGNNKLYAIKKLTKSKLVKVQMERTVYIERDILNKCKHSFILKFFGNFQDDEFLYFVLELCRFDLSKLVQKPLHIEVVRFYAAEIVEAIEHLHSKGVIHRDLKPENIFIAIDGHIRLADFGSAIIVGSEEYIQEHSQQPKKSKQLIGTPLYVSPEVIHNEPATEKSDLWAMGLIFFFLLAGRQLFSGQTQFILLQNIVKATYQLPVGFDEGARDLLSKLIVVDPNQRISIEEIKMHKFFAGTNWSTLHLQTPPINATFQNTSPQNQQQQTISPPKHNDISQVASSVLSNSLIRQQRRASQIAEAAESVFGILNKEGVESITYAQARQRRSSSVTRSITGSYGIITSDQKQIQTVSPRSPNYTLLNTPIQASNQQQVDIKNENQQQDQNKSSVMPSQSYMSIISNLSESASVSQYSQQSKKQQTQLQNPHFVPPQIAPVTIGGMQVTVGNLYLNVAQTLFKDKIQKEEEQRKLQLKRQQEEQERENLRILLQKQATAQYYANPQVHDDANIHLQTPEKALQLKKINPFLKQSSFNQFQRSPLGQQQLIQEEILQLQFQQHFSDNSDSVPGLKNNKLLNSQIHPSQAVLSNGTIEDQNLMNISAQSPKQERNNSQISNEQASAVVAAQAASLAAGRGRRGTIGLSASTSMVNDIQNLQLHEQILEGQEMMMKIQGKAAAEAEQIAVDAMDDDSSQSQARKRSSIAMVYQQNLQYLKEHQQFLKQVQEAPTLTDIGLKEQSQATLKLLQARNAHQLDIKIQSDQDQEFSFENNQKFQPSPRMPYLNNVQHPFASSEGALFSPDLQTLNNTANNDKLFIQRNGQLSPMADLHESLGNSFSNVPIQSNISIALHQLLNTTNIQNAAGQNEQQKEMVKLPVGENEYNPFENETSVDVPRAGEPMQSNRQNGDLVFNEENTDNPFQQLKGQRGIEMQNILAIVNRSDVLQQQEQGQQGRRRESSNIQGRRRSGIEVDIDANDIANFQNWIQCAINDGENDEIAQYNQQYQERALLQQRQEQEQKENRKKLLAERKAKKKQERDRQEQIRDEKRRKKLKRKDALLLGPDFQQDWDQAMSEINTRKVYDPNNWLYLDDCSSRSSQSEDDVASLSSSPETEEYKKEIRRRDRIKKRQQIKINKEMKRKKNLGKKGASEQYNSKTGIDVEDEEDEEDDDIVDDFDLFVQQNSDSINEGENSQINFSSLTDTSSYDSSDEKEAHFNGLLKYINTHKQELENQESYLYCVDNAMQVDIVKQKFTGKERRRLRREAKRGNNRKKKRNIRKKIDLLLNSSNNYLISRANEIKITSLQDRNKAQQIYQQQQNIYQQQLQKYQQLLQHQQQIQSSNSQLLNQQQTQQQQPQQNNSDVKQTNLQKSSSQVSADNTSTANNSKSTINKKKLLNRPTPRSQNQQAQKGDNSELLVIQQPGSALPSPNEQYQQQQSSLFKVDIIPLTPSQSTSNQQVQLFQSPFDQFKDRPSISSLNNQNSNNNTQNNSANKLISTNTNEIDKLNKNLQQHDQFPITQNEFATDPQGKKTSTPLQSNQLRLNSNGFAENSDMVNKSIPSLNFHTDQYTDLNNIKPNEQNQHSRQSKDNGKAQYQTYGKEKIKVDSKKSIKQSPEYISLAAFNQALFFSPLTGLSRPRSKSPNKNKKSPSPDHDQLHKKDTDKMYPHWTINIHDGESIIQKGFVDVWLKQGKKVRLMVLTSLNRCMLFDPKTNQLTGEIVLGTQVWAEAYDAVRLVVHTKLSNVVIDDPTKKDAMAWAENLNRATVAVTNSFSPQKRPQTMVQSSSAQHTNYNSGRHSK